MNQVPPEKKILKLEKTANNFGDRWAKGYINNYSVGDVYDEAHDWVKDLVEQEVIESGYVREVYPKTDVGFEFGLIAGNKIYFFKTEWYSDGEISHGYGHRDLYIKK